MALAAAAPRAGNGAGHRRYTLTTMRALACLVPAVLLIAADPDPASFIQPDAVLSARTPDLQRSQVRWKTTPYPGLLQTVWGRMLVAEWGARIDRAAPGASAALGGLQSAAVGLRTEQGSPPAVIVAVQGQAALLRAAALTLMPESLPGQALTLQGASGRATLHGGVLAWANGAGEAVLPEGPAEAPLDAEADLLVRLDLVRWTAAMGLPGNPQLQGLLDVAVRLDPIGLRETMLAPASEASRLAAVAVRRWADPEELRRLPATTLWAATWHAEPQVSGRMLPADGDPGLAQLERMLADAGLPGWRDTWMAIDGPVTISMAEGVPFPSLTCAISMHEAVARRWIAAAATQLNLATQDGAASGFIGLLACSIGWIAEEGATGRLVITSDPAGLDAWRQRKPGFAGHAGVREVLAKVPPRTVLLGAGRGGPSWAALAQLAVPVFTAMGAPQAVSLPVDLRKATDRGWIYAQLQEDGTARIESGGLSGGLFTTMTMTGIAVPATMWLQGEQRRQQRRQRVEEPAPEAAPQPAPVF